MEHKTLHDISYTPRYKEYQKHKKAWIAENLTQDQIQTLRSKSNYKDIMEYEKEIGLIDFCKKYWKEKNKK